MKLLACRMALQPLVNGERFRPDVGVDAVKIKELMGPCVDHDDAALHTRD
jgi:hypothetical protein